MKTIADLLKLHEGLRLRPYWDTAVPPKLTIGYGHNLTARPLFWLSIGPEIPRWLAEAILAQDIEDAREDLHGRWPWVQTFADEVTVPAAVRYAVLLDMCFNMGGKRLATFKNTLMMIHAGNYGEASRQMLKSKWAGQVGMKVGQRAWRLSEMMRTGEWPNDI